MTTIERGLRLVEGRFLHPRHSPLHALRLAHAFRYTTHQCANNRAQPRRYRYPRPDRARKFPHIKKRASGRALGRALAYQDKTRRGLRGEQRGPKTETLACYKEFF